VSKERLRHRLTQRKLLIL